MRAQIRIVSGHLRGRKLTFQTSPHLRPTPDMVREALFSILGNATPDRVFVDIFSGTGVMGIEALSRGAKQSLFIERDVRLAGDVERHLREFNLNRQARLFRTDAYRWASAWQPPAEPVNIFLSPPFADLQERSEDMIRLVSQLQDKVAPESVITLQAERNSPLEESSQFHDWEKRKYGRNVLFLWQKEEATVGQHAHPDQAQLPSGSES
jgi:16S rRNA (guanine966-N2)-methyltransferase